MPSIKRFNGTDFVVPVLKRYNSTTDTWEVVQLKRYNDTISDWESLVTPREILYSGVVTVQEYKNYHGWIKDGGPTPWWPPGSPPDDLGNINPKTAGGGNITHFCYAGNEQRSVIKFSGSKPAGWGEKLYITVNSKELVLTSYDNLEWRCTGGDGWNLMGSHGQNLNIVIR